MTEQIKDWTNQVIGAAIEVHRQLGPGLLERTYEECLFIELRERKIEVERQVKLPIEYRGHRIDDAYRLDLLVQRSLVVELKTVEKIAPVHRAQLLTYLRFGNFKYGLLFNFHEAMLRDGLVRVIN